jgi:hypothetical protein
MNIKAIIASLVLGSSSVAMASPGVTFEARGSLAVGTSRYYPVAQPAQPIVRDHRGTNNDGAWIRDHRGNLPAPERMPPVYANPPVDNCENISGSYYQGPVGRMPLSGHATIALTAPTRIDNGREIINVDGSSAGVFTQLTLRATNGATLIRSVEVTMGKGDLQTIQVNQWLDARNPTLTFDIDGRRGRVLDQIVVNGQSNFGARYVVTSSR